MKNDNQHITSPISFIGDRSLSPQGNQGTSQGTTDSVVNSPIQPSMHMNISPNSIPNGGYHYPVGAIQVTNTPIVDIPYGATPTPLQAQVYTYEQEVRATSLPIQMQDELIYSFYKDNAQTATNSLNDEKKTYYKCVQEQQRHINSMYEEEQKHSNTMEELKLKHENDLSKIEQKSQLSVTKSIDKCNVEVRMIDDEGEPLKAKIYFLSNKQKRVVTLFNVLDLQLCEYYSDSIDSESIYALRWSGSEIQKPTLLSSFELFNSKAFIAKVKRAGIACKSLPREYREEVYSHLITYLYQKRTKVQLYDNNGWNATPSGMHFVRLNDVSMEKLRRCLENERN